MKGVHLVVMGVAGCGKSEAGGRIAGRLRLPLVEGDHFHPQRNIDKMKVGIALDDADRADWLLTLAAELGGMPQGAVLTCSALKKAYRDTLRRGVPGLRFVHLAITQAESLRRVGARPGHFYPPSLVASQFEALQDPAGEEGVLVVDGTKGLDEIACEVAGWIDSTIRN
ncbi:MAG: gluconokinase [Burkholderiaceae bacterium]